MWKAARAVAGLSTVKCLTSIGMEIPNAQALSVFNPFLCVVKGFGRLNGNKSVTNRTCCVRQRVMVVN